MRTSIILILVLAAAAAGFLAACGGRQETEETLSGAKGKSILRTRVVVEGLRFDITAKPRKLSGGWGVRLLVKISSDDGGEHWIENNPLLLRGEYTSGDRKYGFSEGGLMVYPPKRVRIKAGKPQKISKDFPFDRKGGGIKPGESLELTVKILGMLSTEGTILSPDIATLGMKVSKKNHPKMELRPAEPEKGEDNEP
jgi:hypothetical protein